MDTQGLLIRIKVTAGNLAERTGARELLEPLQGTLPRMQLVWADQGYTGDLSEWVKEHLGWRLEVVRRPTVEEHRETMWATAKERQKAGATLAELYAGLTYDRRVDVLPRHWVVERTFA